MTGLYRGPNPTRHYQSPYAVKVSPPVQVRRVTVVGESPTSEGLEKYDTPAGKRLLELMDGKTVPWHDIHGAEPPKWSARVSRARVEDWLQQHPLESEPLLLLGRRVCAAFRIPKDAEWLEWYAVAEHRHPMIAFPHPGGNGWWSVQGNADAARGLLKSLLNGDVPFYDYKREKVYSGN